MSRGADVGPLLRSAAAQVVGGLAALVLVAGVLVAVIDPRAGDEARLAQELPFTVPTLPPAEFSPGAVGSPTPTAVSSSSAQVPPREDGEAPAPTSEASPEPSASVSSGAANEVAVVRVVVLGVKAPSSVVVGEQVTFEVTVRGIGGTPVLSTARFGDGSLAGAGTACVGAAEPAEGRITTTLSITHTYREPGSFETYFVATIPCGPSAGAGTSVEVQEAAPTFVPAPAVPSPTTVPVPTPSPPVPVPGTSPSTGLTSPVPVSPAPPVEPSTCLSLAPAVREVEGPGEPVCDPMRPKSRVAS